MELILKTNNEQSIAKIIALTKKLKVAVEKKSVEPRSDDREEIKKRIQNFRAKSPLSFGDALIWQQKEREDRDLPFAK